jgi:hypothetical protein
MQGVNITQLFGDVMTADMVNVVFQGANDSKLLGVGVVRRHGTQADLKAIDRMLQVGERYIGKLLNGPTVSHQLSQHQDYIVVYAVGDGLLPLSLFMRMFDLPLLVKRNGEWSILDRRNADDTIAKAGIFNLPAIRRAPRGGAVVWLLRYKGGQFMPVRAFVSGMQKQPMQAWQQ